MSGKFQIGVTTQQKRKDTPIIATACSKDPLSSFDQLCDGPNRAADSVLADGSGLEKSWDTIFVSRLGVIIVYAKFSGGSSTGSVITFQYMIKRATQKGPNTAKAAHPRKTFQASIVFSSMGSNG